MHRATHLMILVGALALGATFRQASSRAAELRTVAFAGQHAPGTSSGEIYDTFGAHFSGPPSTRVFRGPALNDAGHVAFRANLAGSGVGAMNDKGVWSEGSGNLELVARTGNAAPGGGSFGRAFDPSEITGDSCWSVSGELRFDPDLPNNPLDVTQLYAFADYGRVHRIAPSLGTPLSQEGASAGVGLRLGNEHFTTDLSAAKPLFGRLDDGWRFFLSANAKY